MMDLMSSLGIVCSVAIICFAETELGEYSVFERVVIFLIAEQVLLVFKFILQYSLPANAEWVEELAARNIHIRYALCSFLIPEGTFFLILELSAKGQYSYVGINCPSL